MELHNFNSKHLNQCIDMALKNQPYPEDLSKAEERVIALIRASRDLIIEYMHKVDNIVIVNVARIIDQLLMESV